MKNKRFLLAGIFVVISAEAYASGKKTRSQEWRILPRQDWETFNIPTPPEIDPDGFDTRSKVLVRKANRTYPEITIASDRIPIEGEIVNARTEGTQLFLGEQVFVRGEEQLQVGKTYSITSGPEKVISNRDDRVGFAYDVKGTVKIIGVRDGMFIGTIISAIRPIERNNLLIPEVTPYSFPEAVPSSTVIPASILKVKSQKLTMITDESFVLLDAGTNYGVKVGMIFRRYLKKDPKTKTTITTKDYLVESDLQIIEAKDQFSVAFVKRSRSLIHPNDEVLSLMDLRDFEKNTGMQVFIQNDGQGTPLDDLDKMDDSQGLGEKEDRELRQLEKVDPNQVDSPAVIGNEPAPNDQIEKPINEEKKPENEKVETEHVSEPPVTAEPATDESPAKEEVSPEMNLEPSGTTENLEPPVDASATPDTTTSPAVKEDEKPAVEATLEPPADATATPDASATPETTEAEKPAVEAVSESPAEGDVPDASVLPETSPNPATSPTPAASPSPSPSPAPKK